MFLCVQGWKLPYNGAYVFVSLILYPQCPEQRLTQKNCQEDM